MMYKTMTLELIQEQPGLYERLRTSKRLLPAMDAYAIELKSSHEAWKARLAQARPGSDPLQASGEAMELAIEELRGRLSSAVGERRNLATDLARRGDDLPQATHAGRVSAGARPIPAAHVRPAAPILPGGSTACRHPRRFPPASTAAPPGPASATVPPPPVRSTARPCVAKRRRAGAASRQCPPMPFRPRPATARRVSRSRPGGGGSLRRKAPIGGAGNARRRKPTMEGTDTNHTAATRLRARKPRPATSSPPSARCKQHRARAAARHAGRTAGARPLRRLRGGRPVASSPTRSPADTRTPAGRPSARSSKSLLTPEEYD